MTSVVYRGYTIIPHGELWACPALGIRGTLYNVKLAIDEIVSEGWTRADIRREKEGA